jgi:hypothetical protein
MAARSIDLAPFRRRLEFVPILVGLVLLVAAVLKTYHMASEPVAETSWVTSRWFQISLVEWELLLGLALLTGVMPRMTRLAALASFVVFAVYNVYQISTGEGSCGCFGKISIDPLYTFWLDVAVVLAMGLWDPGFGTTLSGLVSSRTAGTLAVFLLAGAGAALVMAGTVTSTLDKQGRLSGSGRWVIVDPAAWPGQRLPLLSYIDIGDELAKGEWIVVFYRHNCHRCKAAMPRYRHDAEQMIEKRSRARFALVEMSPYGDLGMPTEPCVRGKLSDGKRWLLDSPVELQMKDGIVLSVEAAESAQQPPPAE